MYNMILVDDEEYSYRFVKKHIDANRQLNINVCGCFEDGTAAYDYIVKNENISIVLTDIRMAEMSGMELAQRISENFPQIKIIIMSAYTIFSDAQLAIKYNVSAYLVKPFEFSELDSVLDNILSQLNAETYKDLPKNYAAYGKDNIKCGKFIEEYFFNGYFSRNDILKKAEKEGFSFNLEKTHCCHIKSKIMNFEYLVGNRWKYSYKMLSIAVHNIFQMTLNAAFIYELKFEGGEFEYLVFYDKELPPITDKFKIFEENDFCVSVTFCRQYANIFEYAELNGFRENQGNLKSAADIINKAVEYIKSHYSEDLTRETLSRKFYLHPSYFARQFKTHTGKTLNDYILGVRMEKAMELLGQQKLKVQDVLKMVGYTDSSYFFKQFKKYTGMGPNEYRKNLNNSEVW